MYAQVRQPAATTTHSTGTLTTPRRSPRRTRSAAFLPLIAALLLSAPACNQWQRDDPRVVTLAKKYGRVRSLQGRVVEVTLHDRKGVNAVLPLLKRLPKLQSLRIIGVRLTDEDLRNIGGRNLVGLRLSSCGISDDQLRFLRNMTSLRELDLLRNPITDAGLKHLSSMTRLVRLDLSYTDVQGPGFAHLSDLSDLEYIYASGSRLDDSAMQYWAQLSKLRRVDFLDTNVSDAGLMKLTHLCWLETIMPSKKITMDAMLKFRELQLRAKRKARAKGIKVPPDWARPFGTAVAAQEERQMRNARNQREDSLPGDN